MTPHTQRRAPRSVMRYVAARPIVHLGTPFAPGSGGRCLSKLPTVRAWIRAVIDSIAAPRLEWFEAPIGPRSELIAAVVRLVDGVFRDSGAGNPNATAASRSLWRWLWCDIAERLVTLGKIPGDARSFLRVCMAPDFVRPQPTTLKTHHAAVSR